MGGFEFAAIAVISMTVASMWKAWTKSRTARRDEELERRLMAMESRMLDLDSMRSEMLLSGRVQVLEELAGRAAPPVAPHQAMVAPHQAMVASFERY